MLAKILTALATWGMLELFRLVGADSRADSGADSGAGVGSVVVYDSICAPE